MCWQNNKTRNNKFVTVVTASTMQYLTQHPNTHEEGNNVLKVCRWSIAAGKRPVPFRTRKLSLHTLMVLQPGGCGRVSHRRHQTTTNNKIQKQQRRRRTTTVSFSFYVLPQQAPHDGTSPHTSSGFRPHGTAHTCRKRGRQRTLNPSFYPRCFVGCDSGNPCGFRAPYSNTNTPTKATCP